MQKDSMQNTSSNRLSQSLKMAFAFCVIVLLIAGTANVWAAGEPPMDSGAPRRVKVLFLGDHGHHDPLLRLRQVYSHMGQAGIDFTYTDRVSDHLAKLAGRRMPVIDASAFEAGANEIAKGNFKTPRQIIESLRSSKG